MQNIVREGYGALSKDTELLTPTGWLNVTEVTKETLVAQYSVDGYISFTQPIFIRAEKVDRGIRVHNYRKNYDQLTGIYHAIPYVDTKTNQFKIMPANRITRNSTRKYIYTGILFGGSIVSLSPLDRLRIAFQADGTISRRNINTDYIMFSFTKERKIVRLHNLLKSANVSYKTCVDKDNVTHFYFSAPLGFYEKEFSWIDLSHVSQSWCQEFIEELSHWDGYICNSKHFYCQYFNTNKIAVDQAQAIAILTGYKTHIGNMPCSDFRKHTFYMLGINGRNKHILGDTLITDIVQYDDIMYQVMTPSKMLVIRRNNAVSITGCQNYMLPNNLVINKDCKHLT